MILVPALICLAWTFRTGTFELGIEAPVFAVMSDEFLGNEQFFAFVKNDLTDEILITLVVTGCMLTGFSRLTDEDEFTAKIRYESLAWALWFNFVLLMLATWLVYGLFYLQVMMLSMISVPLFFVARFHLMLYKLKKMQRDDQ